MQTVAPPSLLKLRCLSWLFFPFAIFIPVFTSAQARDVVLAFTLWPQGGVLGERCSGTSVVFSRYHFIVSCSSNDQKSLLLHPEARHMSPETSL